MSLPCTILIALLAQSPGSSPAVAPTPAQSAPVFELPAGGAMNAVLELMPSTVAHESPADLGGPTGAPGYTRDAWTKAATWTEWGRLLAEEAAAHKASKPPDPGRRARLSLLALEQGRTDDAWAHFASTRADPTWTAALLPRFLPGVAAATPLGKGGLAGMLPDGSVLAPSLPPPSKERMDGRIDRRAMSVSAIHVGAAVISMRVSIESEGVQIEVRHVSGGAARVAVVIPESPDWSFGNEYVDWYRQDVMRVPHYVDVKPGEEEHTFYGRFETQQPRRFATNLPAFLPAQLESGGLWLVAREDEQKALLQAAAASIATVLRIPCSVRAPGSKASWSGTTVDLDPVSDRASKLSWLASAVERFTLLSPAPR